MNANTSLRTDELVLVTHDADTDDYLCRRGDAGLEKLRFSEREMKGRTSAWLTTYVDFKAEYGFTLSPGAARSIVNIDCPACFGAQDPDCIHCHGACLYESAAERLDLG